MTTIAIVYTAGELITDRVFAAVQYGDLCGLPVFKDEYAGDPVLSGRYRYEDGGWTYISPPPKRPKKADPENPGIPPECKKDCPYRQKFAGFDLQRNALRMELANMIIPDRCGWNLLPGYIGGRPLDYAHCTANYR